MGIRLSLASMLTALAVLAIPVASIRAQGTDPGPSAKAVAPEADTPAADEAPGVAAQPTPAGATPKLNPAEPSPERAAALRRLAQVRKERAARRLSDLRSRQAAYAQWRILLANREMVALRERQIWLDQQISSVRASESSNSSSSSSSSSNSSSSNPSQDSTRQYPRPSYPPPVATPPSQPAPPSRPSTADEARKAQDDTARRYKPF